MEAKIWCSGSVLVAGMRGLGSVPVAEMRPLGKREQLWCVTTSSQLRYRA